MLRRYSDAKAEEYLIPSKGTLHPMPCSRVVYGKVSLRQAQHSPAEAKLKLPILYIMHKKHYAYVCLKLEIIVTYSGWEF